MLPSSSTSSISLGTSDASTTSGRCPVEYFFPSSVCVGCLLSASTPIRTRRTQLPGFRAFFSTESTAVDARCETRVFQVQTKKRKIQVDVFVVHVWVCSLTLRSRLTHKRQRQKTIRMRLSRVFLGIHHTPFIIGTFFSGCVFGCYEIQKLRSASCI